MITLYALPTGNCHRVSIMLEEVGAPYQLTMLDYAAGDMTSPAFLAINPVGQVPAISVAGGPQDGMVLAESAAILAWLARRAGLLLPADEAERTSLDRWLAIVSGGLQSAITTIFFARMIDADAHIKIVDKLIGDVHRYLRAMDAHLATYPYLAGATYTYVDILGFTIAHKSLGAVGLNLTAYPAIERWRATLADRPAIQRGIAALTVKS